MTEPLAFAARLLVQRGALVEERDGALESVLPPPLARELGLPEAVTFAGEERPGARPVTYGGELLEKLIGAATAVIPAAAARVTGAAPKDKHAVGAAERLVFRNGVFTITGARARTGQRLLLHAAYVLHGDERREGLTAASISAHSSTPVPSGTRIPPETMEPAPWSEAGAKRIKSLLPAALAACSADAGAQAASYRETLDRRLLRDRERIENYFKNLEEELGRRKGRRGADPAAIKDKRAAMARDRSAKLESLSARFSLRIEIRPVAAVLLEVPVSLVSLVLKRRKGTRPLELEYDGACHTLVPVACEHCRGPAPRPAACDTEMHLLCETCAPKSEGRVACPVCGTR
jgi:hypothetical protein